MLRTIIWFIYFWLYLLACAPASLYLFVLERMGQSARADAVTSRFVRKWARRLTGLAGGKIIVRGEENLPAEAAVFIANHQGNFDVPIMLGFVGETRGLIAKQELGRIPLLRSWMRRLHCMFLDRSSPRAGAQSIVEGAGQLAQGHGLTIFPEGTRSRGEAMRPFKGGAFRIATKAGAPVVPVTIDGSYRMMEANGGVRIGPATVYVTIHPPIETKSMPREAQKALPERVQAIVASALRDPAQRAIREEQ